MKHIENIRRLLRLLSTSERFHSAVVVSPPGWAKSTTVEATLLELKLEHVALGSYTTPLALYQALGDNAGGVLVLDDCAGVFTSVQAMALLKAASWSSAATAGARRVAWASSEARVQSAFVFTGKLVLLANTLPRRAETEAFLSRSLVYRIAFDESDIAELLRSGATSASHFKDTSVATEVAEFLIAHVLPVAGVGGVNFRTLQLGYEMRVDSPDDWQQLLLSVLIARRQVSDPRSLVSELGATTMNVEAQITRFTRETGLSRRSFQVYRRELGLSRSYRVAHNGNESPVKDSTGDLQ